MLGPASMGESICGCTAWLGLFADSVLEVMDCPSARQLNGVNVAVHSAMALVPSNSDEPGTATACRLVPAQPVLSGNGGLSRCCCCSCLSAKRLLQLTIGKSRAGRARSPLQLVHDQRQQHHQHRHPNRACFVERARALSPPVRRRWRKAGGREMTAGQAACLSPSGTEDTLQPNNTLQPAHRVPQYRMAPSCSTSGVSRSVAACAAPRRVNWSAHRSPAPHWPADCWLPPTELSIYALCACRLDCVYSVNS